MASEILMQNINRRNVHQTIIGATVKAAHDPRWLSAISKVEKRLNQGGWAFNGTTLRIHSSHSTATKPVVYTVTPMTCQCRAFELGIPCVHRAAAKILRNAMGFASRVEQTVRISPAEAAIDRINEAALDADYQAMTDDLNDALFGGR